MNRHFRVLCCLLFAYQSNALAQQSSQQTTSAQSHSQPRVYISDSQSWEMVGGWGMSGSKNANGSGSFGGGGYTAGGARPQTAEIIKTFNQRCSSVTITNNIQKADFAVILDHEGGKGLVHRRNKIAVFNRDGDVIFSDSTRELGNSVKDACQAILTAPPLKPQQATPPPASPQPAASVSGASPPQTSADASIEVTSTPSGADIELDGSFVGTTPSTVGVSAGDHAVSIKKGGYKRWERKLKVSSGNVNISAELEAETKQTSLGVSAETTRPSAEAQQKTEPNQPDNAKPEIRTAETFGTVSLTSDPSGADVYVDDFRVGTTSGTFKLTAGQHYIRTFMKDYKNWSRQITVEADSELHLAITLEKAN